MKKYFKVLFVLLVAILLVGCSSDSNKDTNETNNEETVVRKCTISQDNTTQGYKVDSTYEIHAKGKVVEKVVTKEIVTSSDEDVLDYFEEQLNTSYNKASNAYGGYTYKVVKGNNTVTSDVEIDYSKMNLDKYVKDTPVLSSYLNEKNQMTLSGITMLYKSFGATCE